MAHEARKERWERAAVESEAASRLLALLLEELTMSPLLPLRPEMMLPPPPAAGEIAAPFLSLHATCFFLCVCSVFLKEEREREKEKKR